MIPLLLIPDRKCDGGLAKGKTMEQSGVFRRNFWSWRDGSMGVCRASLKS